MQFKGISDYIDARYLFALACYTALRIPVITLRIAIHTAKAILYSYPVIPLLRVAAYMTMQTTKATHKMPLKNYICAVKKEIIAGMLRCYFN